MPYVISKNNIPLMPCSEHRARHLISAGEASIIKQAPFVIQLTIDSTEEVQHVMLCANVSGNFVELVVMHSLESLYYKFQKISKQSDAFGALLFIKQFLPVSQIVIGVSGYDLFDVSIDTNSIKRINTKKQYSIYAYVLARDSHICRICGTNDTNIKLYNFFQNMYIPQGLISICNDCHKRIENDNHKNSKFKFFKEEAGLYKDTLGYVVAAVKQVFLKGEL